MLNDPISQSSSETQGQIVGRGKVGRGEKKVGEKKSRALDFSSPTVFFIYIFFLAMEFYHNLKLLKFLGI